MKGAFLVAVCLSTLALVVTGCDKSSHHSAFSGPTGPTGSSGPVKLIAANGGNSTGGGNGGAGGLIQIVASDNIKFEEPSVQINVPLTPPPGPSGTHITSATSTSELVGAGVLQVDPTNSSRLIPVATGDMVFHAGTVITNDRSETTIAVTNGGNLFVDGTLKSGRDVASARDLTLLNSTTNGAVVINGTVSARSDGLNQNEFSGDITILADNVFVAGTLDASGADSPVPGTGGDAGFITIEAPTSESRERTFAFLESSLLDCSGGSTLSGSAGLSNSIDVTTRSGPLTSIMVLQGEVRVRGGNGTAGGSAGSADFLSSGTLFWKGSANLSGGHATGATTGGAGGVLVVGSTNQVSGSSGAIAKTPTVRVSALSRVEAIGGQGAAGGSGGRVEMYAKNEIAAVLERIEASGGTATASVGGPGGLVKVLSADGAITLTGLLVATPGGRSTASNGGPGGGVEVESDTDDPVTIANFPTSDNGEGGAIAVSVSITAAGGEGQTQGGAGGSVSIASDPKDRELSLLGAGSNASEVTVGGGRSPGGTGGSGGTISALGSNQSGGSVSAGGFTNSGVLVSPGGAGLIPGSAGLVVID